MAASTSGGGANDDPPDERIATPTINQVVVGAPPPAVPIVPRPLALCEEVLGTAGVSRPRGPRASPIRAWML